MALLKWTEALSVKIDSIDAQHKKLFDLLNEFYDNIKMKSNSSSILKLVTGMKEYTQKHFSMEEKYMSQHGYPKFKEHQLEHAQFIKKVEDLEERLKKGSLIISFEVTNFIKEWIKNHIQTTDMQYSDFLISKGVK